VAIWIASTFSRRPSTTAAVALGRRHRICSRRHRLACLCHHQIHPSLPVPAHAERAAAASLRRHVLPKDLPAAIKQLDDQELDRLQAAVLAEQKRRGRKPADSVEPPNKRRLEASALHLTPGKLNAVRAAFKVGVEPSQIARQFDLSQSDLRKALASDASMHQGERRTVVNAQATR
jgi:hypothetical protein